MSHPVKFLSQEWARALTDLLNASPEFRATAGNVELTMAQVVTGGPDGDVTYHLRIDRGEATVALGEAETPDVTATQSYSTAVAIARGDLTMQNAFMTGRLRVTGNLAKVMAHQASLVGLEALREDLAVEY